MASFSRKIGLILILALTAALTDACASGCGPASSLLLVTGDSIQGSEQGRFNAIPADQVCVERSVGLGAKHVINP